MDPEDIFEAIIGFVILIVLISVFADVVFSLQGPVWGAFFVLMSIAIVFSYILGEF